MYPAMLAAEVLVPCINYAAKHRILASGVNKIVPGPREAFLRIKEFACPLWDTSAKMVNVGIGSIIGKLVVLFVERIKNRASMMLVDGTLGY